MKPLDRNTQIGRIYHALKSAKGGWLSTREVAEGCVGWDEYGKKFNGSCLAPSTKISQLKERLPQDEEIIGEPVKDGSGIWHYRLEKIK